MSFSFSKNDLELPNNATDLTIRSDTKTYLTFGGWFSTKIKIVSLY